MFSSLTTYFWFQFLHLILTKISFCITFHFTGCILKDTCVNTVTLSYFHIVKMPHCHIVIFFSLSQCHIVMLPCCQSVTLARCYNVTFSQCHIVTSSYCQSVTLPHCCIVTCSHCQESLIYRSGCNIQVFTFLQRFVL